MAGVEGQEQRLHGGWIHRAEALVDRGVRLLGCFLPGNGPKVLLLPEAGDSGTSWSRRKMVHFVGPCTLGPLWAILVETGRGNWSYRPRTQGRKMG